MIEVEKTNDLRVPDELSDYFKERIRMADYMGERREYIISADIPILVRENYRVEAGSVAEAIAKIREGEEEDREFVDYVDILGEHENIVIVEERVKHIP